MSDNEGPRVADEEEEEKGHNEDEDVAVEPNSLEDEISEDEEEEEEESRPKPAKKKKEKKKKRSAFIDDAAEEEEDGRKLKRSRFIDDIAEVDDEDDEDDEDEEGMDDLIDDQGELPDAADQALVRRAIRDAEIKAQQEDDINPEELQQYLQQRFGRDRVAAYAAGDQEPEAGGAVSQQALMPTVKDPKLWVIRCADGAEREVTICLLQKCYDYANRGQPLLIKSVFCKEELKGYLYVEAFKEAHVKEALQGLRSVFNSKAPKLVPLGEMVSAISVPRSAQRTVQPGSWARPKTGVYKGDLAKVIGVDINAGRATIKLVPRLDFAAMAARRAEGRRGFEKAAKIRPAARAFNPDEARGFQFDVMLQRDRATGDMVQILNNSMRFSKGYLVKTVTIKSLHLEGGLPPLDELQRFNSAQQDGDDGDGPSGAGGAGDLTALVQDLGVEGAAALEAATLAKFIKGDRVIVREGDLKGILGKVEHVTEDGQVMVQAMDDSLGDFKDAIGFAPRELSKWFDTGDHVKVVNGSHTGETGMVMKLEDGVCYVLTDATREEIKVFARDLVDAVATVTTDDKIGDYEMFDCVVLDTQTVGVIVGVEKETCRVLTNAGDPAKPEVRVCRLPDIKRKINNRNASAQDGARNEISVNDIVQIEEGPLRGRAGTVKHIMRSFLFIQSREIAENGGYACVLSRSTSVRGGTNRNQASQGAGYGLATPARHSTPLHPGAIPASPAHHSMGGGGFQGGGGGAGGYTGRQATQQYRLLEGTHVKMKSGPYRGLKGIIKSATATQARVELEANQRTVTVDRKDMSGPAGNLPASGASMGMGLGIGMGMRPGSYGAPAVPAPGGRTPAHYSQATMPTPAHYSSMATPMHPGMTPGRDTITKTPAYDPAWAATPAHPGFGGSDTNGISGATGYGAPASTGGGFNDISGYGGGASAAPAASAVPGPMEGTSSSDWVGLEVELPTGERAAVRSVGTDGKASVQMGRATGEGNKHAFDGSLHSVEVVDLKLVTVAKGDKVRVLTGSSRSAEPGVVNVLDGNDAFAEIPGKGLVVVPVNLCAKIAVEA